MPDWREGDHYRGMFFLCGTRREGAIPGAVVICRNGRGELEQYRGRAYFAGMERGGQYQGRLFFAGMGRGGSLSEDGVFLPEWGEGGNIRGWRFCLN